MAATTQRNVPLCDEAFLGHPRPRNVSGVAMRNMFGVIACLFLCGNAVVPVLAAPTVDTARMEQVVNSEAVDNKFMGSVLVAKDHQILLDRGYGSADLEWNIPNSPTTRFRAGSMGKQFTAAAVLLLEERGKLKLSDPIKLWWPSAPVSWDGVTLLNLLTQTSGIPDFAAAPDFFDTMKLKQTMEQRIATIEKQKLLFEPGLRFDYSNSNYLLLEAVVEKASGMSFPAFVQQNVFEPLGMTHTGYESRSLISEFANGYTRENGAIVHASYIDMSAVGGAGAFYSTTHDLLAWEQGLFEGRLLKPASLKKMITAFREGWGPGAPFKGGYGMGVYVGVSLDGKREISHTGDIPGFMSLMAAYPDDKLYVIVLTNIQSAPFGEVANRLTDIALGKAVTLPSERKEIMLPPDALRTFLGRYELKPGVVMEISQSGNALFAQVNSNPKIPLGAQTRTSFFAKDRDAQLDFLGNGSKSNALLWQLHGDTVKALRLP
jgi:CubicO group peptidase (beta-lactamase class C family)